MVDTVFVGTVADDGTGDPLHTAFENINTAIAALQAEVPITVTGLNALTLSASTVVERSARGTAIGNIVGKTGGSVLRMADPMETQFQINGLAVEVGPQLIDTGTRYAVVEEIIDTGTDVLSKTTTLAVTVTRDAATWPVIVPTIWVGNADTGTADGLTYANRKNIRTIGASLTPGAIVGVAEDIDPLTTGMPQTISGTALNPIKYCGVDSTGKRTMRFFTGIRHVYTKLTHDVEETLAVLTDTDDHVTGTNAFQLQGGLGYYDFEDLGFINMQICYNVQAPLTHNINISRMYAKNVYRSFETTNANYANDVYIKDACVIMFSKGQFRWRGASNNLTLENVYADCMRLDGDSWGSMGAMDHTSTNVNLINCEAKNCHNDQGAAYWNADGWSIENDNNGLTVTNFTSTGHTDAGIDCKTGSTVLNVTGGFVGDNKRNIKCWAGVSGNGKFHFDNVTFGAPRKRGGSGSACLFNCNGNGNLNVPYAIEVRIKDMDTRMADRGWTGQELAHSDATTAVIYKFINTVRDAVPVYSNVDLTGKYVRFMIAAALPVGSPSLTSSVANVTGGLAGSSATYIPLTSNRDASDGGIIVRSIGGASGALFKIGGTEYSTTAIQGIAQRIEPAAPITYTGTGSDVKSITLLIEDIAGNQATVPFTVTVVADTADHRTLDISFAGANNAQTAVDSTTPANTITWGTSAKISTVHDAAGSLRIPFTADGSTIGKVFAIDSTGDDFDIAGMWTLVVDDLYFDVAATGLNQTAVSRWGSDKTFRLYADPTGHLTFSVWDNAIENVILVDSAALSNATDYDIKIRRTLVPGPGGQFLWEMVKNGSVVASVTNGLSPGLLPTNLTIGATNLSTQYMQGYVKRVAVYKDVSTGT